MDDNFFSGAKSEEVVISTGVRIRLPERYLDWSWMNAFFPASAARVRRLLPSDKLKPFLIMPGVSMVSLTAMEYRKIADVAPYNEFSLSVPVQYEPLMNVPGLPVLFHPLFSPRWYRKFGMYIRHLPVTTQGARDFGVEIWGYPKFVAEISFEDRGATRRCRLRSKGKDIVVLDVGKMATKEQRIDFYTYSVKDGRLLRTPVQTQGEYGITRMPGGASYALGDHPLAQELRSLGMGKTAVGRIYAPQVQSMLNAASERLAM